MSFKDIEKALKYNPNNHSQVDEKENNNDKAVRIEYDKTLISETFNRLEYK